MRGEVVGRTATAEGEASVGGALAVDDQVPVVAEGLAVGQPDGIPHRPAQRLGRQHERVDRRELASQARQCRGEAFGRPDHDVGGDVAVGRPYDVRLDRARRGALVDAHAVPLRGERQPAHQPSGVDGRAVWRPGAAEHAGGAHAGPSLRGVEQLEVQSPGLRLGHLGAGARELHDRAGGDHGPALVEVAVDILERRHLPDRVDRLLQRPGQGERALAPVPLGHRGDRGGEQRGAPPAVAAGGAEARGLLLDDEDP